MTIYSFDFLQQVVNVHFVSGGFILLTAKGVSQSSGSPTPPPAPSVKLSLGAKEKLIARQDVITTTSVPAHNVTVPLFFIWPGGHTLPTPLNYGNVVEVDVAATFAGQFSQIIDMGGSGFLPVTSFGIHLPETGGTGIYSTLAIAKQAASIWNARWAGGAPSTTTWFNADGSTTTGGYADVAAAQLNVVVPVPASASSTLNGKYLISVPDALTTMTAVLSAANTSTSMRVDGYSTPVPKSIAGIKGAPDSTETVSGPAGTATFTVTSQVLQGPADTVVSVAAG